MRCMRAHVIHLERDVRCDSALYPEIPVLAGRVLQIWIEQRHHLVLSVDERQARGRTVREGNRLRSICSRESIEYGLLKGRIPASIAKDVVEYAIVEDSIGSANRCLAIPVGVPGESNSRLNVREVVGVNIVPGS